MSATTMHFGPEWMRTKQPTTAARPPNSPPPPASAPTASAFSYSALVSPAPDPGPQKRVDEVHPFRYSKEDMLRIYKEGPRKPGLGLEVERWEGVIREVEIEPVAIKDMTDAERKLFAGPLNSELRRRQSADLLSPLNTQSTGTERPRLNHNNSTGSPLRERFGGLMGRRRDSSDQTIPRKLSLSSNQAPQLGSPRDTGLPSPRTRIGGYTPSFDGVLNSGESWVARRKASEGLLKTSLRAEPADGDPKPSTIRKEDDAVKARERSNTDQHSQSKSLDSPPIDNNVLDSNFSNLSLSGQSLPVLSDEPGGTTPIVGPPPGIVDLASVEWSYLDPQGQIQGPFRADLMQKWYDEGYFAQDLLMKRTQVDTEWLAVGELARRSGGDKLFLSPPALPPAPPGLGRRTESPLQSFTDQALFNAPYQPAPIRSLRTSTLESYISTSNPSDTAFSATRFADASPDPSAFSSVNSTFTSVSFNGPSELSGFPISRRSTNDQLDRSPAFSNLAPGRTPSADNFHSAYSPNTTGPWQNGTSNFDNHPYADLVGPYANNTFSGNTPSGLLQNNGFSGFNDATGNFNGNHNFNNGMSFPNSQPNLQYTHYPQQQPSSPLLNSMYSGNTPSKPSSLNTNVAPQSPWKTPELAAASPVRRPNLFEASTNNTVVNGSITPSAQSSPWPQPAVAVAQTSTEPSPWFAASQSVIPDDWNETPVQSNLTFDNVGQHNNQQTQPSAAIEKPVAVPVVKTRKAAVAKPMVPVAPTENSVGIVKSPSPSPPSKAPWSSEEELKKVKPSGASLSLRDIQDAEAKKTEARKVAERDRERAARAASATEDSTPFTASWGLPTSQAGSRVIAAPIKETPSPSIPPASAPVWTTGAKPPAAKKSMKEIQEEEERRKKAVAKETTAAAARRAYAETTNKAAPPVANSAWTTVGPGGKGPIGAVRPPAVTANSSLASTSTTVRVNGAAPARAIPAAAPVKAPAPPKAEDPVTPSHDFLKWLNDSLKGLNTSVNVEEIMSMLLSFPMDPDSSTAEIISDLIYANSTTLDGRRFASEFISKRKTDATSRPRGVGSTGSAQGKPISIADVVKAQPKPSQPEWGGFKVVNKKKKGGRT